MKTLLRCLVPMACLLMLAVPALADDKDDDYDKDARYAEGTPPMVPHRIDNRTGEACLACHLSGLNGAPITPHAVRLDCTECHGQGEIKEKTKDKKSKKKQKKAHDD